MLAVCITRALGTIRRDIFMPFANVAAAMGMIHDVLPVELMLVFGLDLGILSHLTSSHVHLQYAILARNGINDCSGNVNLIRANQHVAVNLK